MLSIKEDCFIAVHTSLRNSHIAGEEVLEVVKTEKINQPDENTYAKLKDNFFHNGTIEVDVYSQLLEDAPDYARGFIGLAFRIREDDSSFESFYIRPTNGRTDDPVRSQRAIQYFAYPTYTFDYFRERDIKDFEGPADIGLSEWIRLKAVVKGDKADFYVNGDLVLQVQQLKLGKDASGSVGLFVDIGTRGYFKNLQVTAEDEQVCLRI
ncbi:hypothetical protein [Streptococcus sp.]|uniref:hypothetical protein n=1 Tax=Streptococcus sp. TaxID=1306 RepID=UPI0035A1243B